ncbi:MAG: hypothetical protein ACLUD2_05310 [Clostridium sp.]
MTWNRLARKTGKTYKVDMCNGPLFPKIVAFAVPLILIRYPAAVV